MYMYSDTNTMSSHNVIHSQPSPPLSSPPPREEQLSIDEISSPISARILELCDSELFPEALQNSEVTCSSSNCCFEENSSSSYATTLDIVENNKLNRNSNTTTTNNNNIIFKSQEEDQIIHENDISASIDFSVPSSSLQFDFSLVQPPLPPPPQVSVSVVNNNNNGIMPHYVPPPMNPSSLSCVFEEEECLVGSYMPMNPSSSNCTYLGPLGIGPYMPPPPPPPGIYGGRTILLGSELQPQDMEFQGENGTGIYCPDSIQRVFNTPDLQALGTENQQVLGVGGSNSTTLTPEISNLEDSTFKVGKLSIEQRKEKIDRYMKKRNERNFNKKIKYACRKTLADSRPRVRGRFAKNDEFGENHRTASSNHEEEDEEEVVVKEEDDVVDSSDIFAYISGVNSFKCNQSIQSWI